MRKSYLLLIILLYYKYIRTIKGSFIPREIKFNLTDSDINKPYKKETVPFYSVVYPIFILVGIFITYDQYNKKQDYDFDPLIDYIILFYGTWVITSTIKMMSFRLRPDFISRCFGNDLPKNDKCFSYKDCKNLNRAKEGMRSFPSGHTSSVVATSIGLISYIIKSREQENKFFNKNPNMSIMIIIAAIMYSLYVPYTRILDNKHRPMDLIGGALIPIIIYKLNN